MSVSSARWPVENKIEAYNLPQGVNLPIVRDTAAESLGSDPLPGPCFVDPRNVGREYQRTHPEDRVG